MKGSIIEKQYRSTSDHLMVKCLSQPPRSCRLETNGNHVFRGGVPTFCISVFKHQQATF